MKKIYILFFIITSYASTAQILLNGRLIHELPAKSSVDTGDLIIVANPSTGKPYKARKNQVIAGANGVTDGDKGDITVSGSGGVFTINGSSVQNGKLAMMGDNTFKGNLSGTTASPQDLTSGQVISALGINLKMNLTDTASLSNRINAKQNTLVSGSNIKSINGNSLVGSGDVTITSTVAWGNITGSNIMLQTDLRDSFEHTIAAGTTGQYWRGDKTWQTLNKAAVGLSAVDNTADVDKPISNATNSALAGKQAQLVSGTNIKTINFQDLLGSGNITISGGSGGGETLDQTLALGNVTDTAIISTSFMNINNTSSTGTPTLTLDHANSGSSKVQVWNYNASLVAEVDKDYSLMAYKPVLLYYGGLTHGDFTFMAGNLNLGSQNLIGGSKIALGLTATKNPFVDLVVGDGGDGTDNEPYGLRLRGNSSDGNTRVLQMGVNTTGIGGDNQGYGYIQFGYWGGSQNNPLVLQPKSGAVVIGTPSGLADYKLQVEKELSVKATSTDAGGALRGRISFPYSSIYSAKSSYIAGINDATNWYESAGLVFATISGPDIAGSQGIERMRIAGNGNVGIGTTTDISASPAKLQIASTTSGFLPPRMTTTQKNAISVPVEGLIVYDTTLHKLCVYTGSAWETITSL